MKTRFFSPQAHQRYQHLLKQRHLRRLRSIGSTNRLTSPDYHRQINQVKIGQYTYYKNRILGSGYSSKVYIANKAGQQTIYAMKVINLKFFKETNMQMLKNQIQIIKSLNHPNILRCYDVIKSYSHCYIITEYCPNGDLLTYMNKRGKVSEERAISIIQQVIHGCQYLFKKNIIHRDIKPANILRSGSNWKIADFGFSIISQNQIKSRCNVGTPLYMPLQSLIENLYSSKSDIFSIGVILYELIFGCTPWQSQSQKELIRKMKKQSFKISQKANISVSMKETIEKMCEINYELRMNLDQFFQIDLRQQCNHQLTENISVSSEIKIQKQRPIAIFQKKTNVKKYGHRSAQILPYFKQRCSSPTLPDTEQQQDHAIKKMQIKNNHIIINQLHYCRFLYYFTRNKRYLLLDSHTTQKVVLLIFRHLLVLITHLADKQTNWLGLEQWQKFVVSKRYKNTVSTIKQYQTRYIKQYSNYLLLIDSSVLQQINDQYGNTNKNNSILNQSFYSKALSLILQALKGCSNVINIILSQQNFQFGPEQAGQVQALNFLQKYYELITIGYTSNSGYVYFQAHSQIKVHVDYKNSGMTANEYHQIAKKIQKYE